MRLRSALGLQGTFLLPAAELEQMVPAQIRGDVARMRPRARRAVAAQKTTLNKAIALEKVVRAGIDPGATTCYGYAAAMVELGRELGLPVRMVAATDGMSDFDAHSTVEVWLAQYGRWGIVDPTFGGIFTRGSNPAPLSAALLRRSLLQGWSSQVVWRSSHGKNAQLPSSYYVDPVDLFRYIGAYARVLGRVELIVLPDSTMLTSGVYVTSEGAFRFDRPATVVSVSLAGVDWTSARPSKISLPPPYTTGQVWDATVTLPTTVSLPSESVAVWVDVPGVTIAGYAPTAVDGGSLSPIFSGGPKVTLDGTGSAEVHVYAAKRFPASRER